ncbi:MAG TPA: cytochrome c3 family protein [Gemmatimonadales bacterium]|nr:cytochrome c3 family protein [Gemmatimonadales bacterium]
MRQLIHAGIVLLLASPLAAQDRTRSPHGDLKLECRLCHKADAWTPVEISKEFDHGKLGFPLTFAHQTATCRSCHVSLDFKGVKSDCASCHTDIHRGELGANCDRCHSTKSFVDRDAMLRAHQFYRFQLVGSHLAVDCSECHRPSSQGQLQYVSTPTTCVSCHQADYDRTTNPNHATTGYSTDCASCHQVIAGFAGANFNHTLFSLTGVHGGLQCAQCHKSGVAFFNAPSTCTGCHGPGGIVADVYTPTTDPPHAAAGFPTTCTTCHQLVPAWANASFNHTTYTTWPLTASAHNAAPCDQCHKTQWKGLASTCGACHGPGGIIADVFTPEKNPDHVAAGFTTNVCTPCHSYNAATSSFAGATYDHTANTTFPLTGAHIPVACNACHTSTIYKGLSTLCFSCHQNDWNSTTVPNHASITPAWPTTCETCHTVAANWPATLPGQYHAWFPSNHQGAGSTCTQCHNTTDYSAYTCSNHHHPASCQYLTTSTATQARGTSSCSN